MSAQDPVTTRQIIPRPTAVSPALYDLVRRVSQWQQGLTEQKVVHVTLEIGRNGICILKKEFIEREQLGLLLTCWILGLFIGDLII
jgi:hypothetical protein